MVGRFGVLGVVRYMGWGRWVRWGYSWVLGFDGSCLFLFEGFGLENMLRFFYVSYRDFLIFEL